MWRDKARHGAGQCGRGLVDQVALKLAPCAAATQNPCAAVPPSCCAQVRSIGHNPKCLCPVMLPDTARRAGVKPAVAITVAKRCAIANGYKCGRKILLVWFSVSSSLSQCFSLKKSTWNHHQLICPVLLCSIHPAMRSKGMKLEGQSNSRVL